MNKKIAVLLVVASAAGCSGTGGRFDPNVVARRDMGTAANPNVQELKAPEMDPKRKIAEQDCSRPVDIAAGNLMCRGEPSEAQKRAMREEEERLAKLRREAEERERLAREAAERERLERERAAQAARDEAARKAREAEEARLAALEAARRAKLEEEERLARAKKEAEERAERERLERERAEREAREAAERERQRLEEEWLAGRAMLESFVAKYGSADKFKSVSGQINTFLNKTR